MPGLVIEIRVRPNLPGYKVGGVVGATGVSV